MTIATCENNKIILTRTFSEGHKHLVKVYKTTIFRRTLSKPITDSKRKYYTLSMSQSHFNVEQLT